jgi:hypothetical protein
VAAEPDGSVPARVGIRAGAAIVAPDGLALARVESQAVVVKPDVLAPVQAGFRVAAEEPDGLALARVESQAAAAEPDGPVQARVWSQAVAVGPYGPVQAPYAPAADEQVQPEWPAAPAERVVCGTAGSALRPAGERVHSGWQEQLA